MKDIESTGSPTEATGSPTKDTRSYMEATEATGSSNQTTGSPTVQTGGQIIDTERPIETSVSYQEVVEPPKVYMEEVILPVEPLSRSGPLKAHEFSELDNFQKERIPPVKKF